MKDGIKLNAYLYRDVVNTVKLPAIISLSPYPSGLKPQEEMYLPLTGIFMFM
jgi:predicted acyl esterase